MPFTETISSTIMIAAPTVAVWQALTDPELVKRWISDDDIRLSTTWEAGSPLVISGDLHGMPMENKGIVLRFEPEKFLSYNYLCSLSELPDQPENYVIIEFSLAPAGNTAVELTVTLRNFPTENIYQHSAFYWRATPHLLKAVAEKHFLASRNHFNP
jgi:uncharacterized protein YndB with AHSA1/START domain